jgi:hypothetical protein
VEGSEFMKKKKENFEGSKQWISPPTNNIPISLYLFLFAFLVFLISPFLFLFFSFFFFVMSSKAKKLQQ